jgi:hypothetical protein
MGSRKAVPQSYVASTRTGDYVGPVGSVSHIRYGVGGRTDGGSVLSLRGGRGPERLPLPIQDHKTGPLSRLAYVPYAGGFVFRTRDQLEGIHGAPVDAEYRQGVTAELVGADAAREVAETHLLVVRTDADESVVRGERDRMNAASQIDPGDGLEGVGVPHTEGGVVRPAHEDPIVDGIPLRVAHGGAVVVAGSANGFQGI